MARRVVVAQARSGRSIDDIALSIVRRFQPEVLSKPMPFDIERFFECALEDFAGVRSDYQELQPGIHGYTDSDEKESVISIGLVEAEDVFSRRFRRSTTGHESGHAVLHVPEFRARKAKLRFLHDGQQVNLRLYRAEHVPTYQNPEWQADRFSGALLMPEQSVRIALRQGCTVEDLSDVFDVHPAFVRSRLRALKLA